MTSSLAWRERPALRRVAGWCLLASLAVVAGAGCDDNPGQTQTSPSPTLFVESFVGTLKMGGTAFYSFTVPVQGTASLTLLTLTIAGAPADVSVTLGIGNPSGTTCRLSSSGPAKAGVAPQVSSAVVPTVYCASITDPGTLTADANFSINIARPR